MGAWGFREVRQTCRDGESVPIENTLQGFAGSFSWKIIRNTKGTLKSQYPEHTTTEEARIGAEEEMKRRI